MAQNFFGQFLLERGHIDRQALLESVRFQREANRSLGELAVARGVMNPEQVELVHHIQRSRDLLFGEIALEHGFLTGPQLEVLLGAQRASYVYLGDALVQIGHLAAHRLPELLAEFARESRREVLPLAAQWAALQVARPEIASVCVDQMRKMLLRMCGLQTKIGQASIGQQMGGRAASLRLTGDLDLELLLCFGEEPELLAAFTDRFMGMSSADEEMIEDARAEFLNIVAGGSAAALQDRGVRLELQPPAGLPADERRIGLLVVPHHCPEGELVLGLVGLL